MICFFHFIFLGLFAHPSNLYLKLMKILLCHCLQAFHVFHVSCLLHWILFCEYETFSNPIESPKWKPLAKKRKTAKMSHTMAMKKHSDAILHSVVCPACQGSGKHIKGAVLEKNPVLPSQVSYAAHHFLRC